MWDFTGCGKWLYTQSLSRMLTHSYGHLAISKHRSFFQTNLSYCAVVCALQCCRLFIVLAAVLEDCGIHRSKISWGPRSECVKAREREREVAHQRHYAQDQMPMFLSTDPDISTGATEDRASVVTKCACASLIVLRHRPSCRSLNPEWGNVDVSLKKRVAECNVQTTR